MRITKFVTVFVTQGHYGTGWDDECSTTDRKEARQTLKEYQENSRWPSRNIRRRVLRTDYEAGNF